MTQPQPAAGRAETWASVSVLLVLVAIAAGVLFKQATFNPAILLTHAPSVIGAVPSDTAGKLITELPGSLREFGPLEQFSPDNLYDKIDGKAELYLAAGFSRMRCQRFALKDSDDSWLEWFEYGMNGIPQAFSVFSTQRRSEGESLDFAEYAYKTANALFFISGTNYYEVVASSTSEPLMEVALQMARSAAKANAAAPAVLTEMQLLPEQNRVPDSQSLQTSDAFGFDQFKNVYTAQYTIDGSELMAFVTSASTPDQAIALVEAYRAFLVENGGKDLESSADLGKAVEIMGTVDMVFSDGAIVAGVHAAPSLSAARKLASVVKARLAKP